MSSPGPKLRWIVLAALLPLLLLAVHVRGDLAASRELDRAEAEAATGARLPEAVCRFPGEAQERARLVVVIVDSLRYETALDSSTMPFLASLPDRALSGKMVPCLSQLSLLCMRTMFEGREPLFVNGLHNFTGMSVVAPNLLARLEARGARVAAVADKPLISLYRGSLAQALAFEDRPDARVGRDAYAMQAARTWLADPSLDAIVVLIIDTDATAHRERVGSLPYAAKFRETDEFLREVEGRLGPRDTFMVLGDHGHDHEGHHSTGVEAPTAYFVRGPLFRPGSKLDTDMATTRFLLGAAACEPVPPRYDGAAPLALLAMPPAYERAYADLLGSAPAARAAAAPANEPMRLLLTRVPAVALLGVLLVLLGRAAAAAGREVVRAIAASGLLLGAGLFAPPAPALGLAATASAALIARRGERFSWLDRVRWGGLAAQVTLGALAHLLLVELQDHVNPTWMIGFWSALVAFVLVAAAVLRRAAPEAAASYGQAAGRVAWAVIFFGLFLGPYYYGAARNLLFGLAWLLLAASWRALRSDRALLRNVALALLSVVPLHAPLLKEWELRYALLTPFDSLGAPLLVGIVVLATGLAALLSPERQRFVRAAALITVFVTLGFATAMPPSTIAGGVLLFLSYQGFSAAAARLGDRWLLPIGQVSYAFMLFFVLFRGLRFANVAFEFVLDWVDASRGEAFAVMVAAPIVIARYCLPVTLLLASAERPGAPVMSLMLYKIAAMVAFYVGMELAAARGAALFLRLLGQEIALIAFLYAFALVAVALRLGVSAEPQSDRS